ncbi:glycine receptor subunit alpha-2-like isoform X2 [Octopus vulgaris]|uniref:Glycine receptor subunit alpha-2-like isoform X2 n=1 Tax=Octopus vulgaris TaxID=6645 RepID=A0AA36BCE7_OCTVU|nr:glycine receptor subunit alpha-2-like isoform X2 [Octopus vulgaris]
MFALHIMWCLFNTVLIAHTARGQVNLTMKSNHVSRSLLIQVMLREQVYDKRLPPNFDKDLPTRVNVSLDFNSFDSIDEMNMEFGVNLVVEQEWIDHRLHFYNLIDSEVLELDVKMMDELWVPDIYISNEKNITQSLMSHATSKIPDGSADLLPSFAKLCLYRKKATIPLERQP